MIVKLEARVQVACHVIYADMHVASAIPYVMPVLEHAKERGGAATESSLSRELFVPLPLCRSLLAYCAENGLVEDVGGGRHALAPDGARALESGRVFTGAEGMWKVYIADHEAIPEGLRVVRIEDGTRDAGYQPRGGKDQPRVKDLEAQVRALEGEVLRPALGEESEAIVRDVHRYEKRIEPDLDIRLRVEPGKGGAEVTLLASRGGDALQGGRQGVPAKARLPGISMTIDDAMGSLLGVGGEGAWDAERGLVLVDYDDASPEELSSMQKTVYVERPEVNGMEFERVRVTAEILPRREADAERWARHLLAVTAAAYVTREEYERLVGDIRGRFPGFDIDMGDRAGHVPGRGEPPGTRGRPRLFWLIQAMEDWDL